MGCPGVVSSCRALRPHLLVVLRSLQGAFTGCPEEPPSHVYRSCRGFPKPRLQVVLRALQAAFTFIILVALQLSFQPMAISSRCCLSIFMHIPRLFLCSTSVGPVTLRRSRQSEKSKTLAFTFYCRTWLGKPCSRFVRRAGRSAHTSASFSCQSCQEVLLPHEASSA